MILLCVRVEQAYQIADAVPSLRDELSEAVVREERQPCDVAPVLCVWYGKTPTGWNLIEEVYERSWAESMIAAIQSSHRSVVLNDLKTEAKAERKTA